LRLDLVGAPVNAGQLVGGQVVVDVGDVDEEGLAGQEAEGHGRPGGLYHQRADSFGVVGHGAAGPFQDVGRIVAHQVAEPVVVLAPVPAVEREELVQPGTSL